jgi:hypothetical protein
MSGPVGALALAVAALAEVSSWRGVVKVEGMIHEPGGYHPYSATITLRLRESERVPVAGGFRVPLLSSGSVNEVRTSVHQVGGPMLCSGVGSETLPDGAVGYLEARGDRTTYRLEIPRAFAAFACGRNRATRQNRIVTIGVGDAVAGEIEAQDSVVRELEQRNAVMEGAFESAKAQGTVRYEYRVSWSIRRTPEP